MEKDGIERRLTEIEERINKLENENDILKIELGNSIIGHYRLEEIKKDFIQTHIENAARLEEQMNSELDQMKDYIKTLKQRCSDLEKENRILLSERSTGILKEVLRQAEVSKKKTGKNPFENV